jgi:hypothetical protein
MTCAVDEDGVHDGPAAASSELRASTRHQTSALSSVSASRNTSAGSGRLLPDAVEDPEAPEAPDGGALGGLVIDW